ncbi:MAG: type I secretion system permease/ATPase [Pseudomonadota bacterium]
MAAEFTLASDGTASDALLAALVALTRIHHKPYSAEALVAGLPLVDGKLDASLFVRAAERAGFKARSVERDLKGIPAEVLPVALICKDNQVLILHERNELDAGVSDPLQPETVKRMSEAALSEIYTGRCFYVKPDYEQATDPDTATDQHWFWSTVRLSRGIYGEVFLASLLINLFALVTPLFVMNVYDRVVPNYATETLWVLASGVFIVFIFDLVVKSLRGYFIDVAGKRADILLSARTFGRVMDIRMSERPGRVGAFASNLQDFDSFRDFFTSTTLITVIDLPFVLLFILLIYGIGGAPLALIPLLAIPLVILFSLTIQGPLQQAVQATFRESSRKHALLIEALTALDGIKAARAEGVIQRRWETFNARLAVLGLRARSLSLATVNVAQAIQQLSTVAIVIAGVYQIMAANLTIGGLIACTILTGRCLAPMSQVASILTRYHHSIAAYGAINRLMQLPVERPPGRRFLHRPTLDGSIQFRQVTFEYPGQQSPALKNLSFSITSGERVGVIGRMGSGKSTLARLVLGFYPPTEGSILVSGTDINQLDPIDLRRNINFVPQDVMLMSGTIRENIVMSAPLSDDTTVLRAAEIAGLLEFVNRHPEGFDLQVGERGANLSGGQRQAIAIARAFVATAPLVLLDEPTNAMDTATESQFKQQLAGYLNGRTLLLITHKTSMLSLVDRLIVMNNGEIVADGPRDKVLTALSGGQA